MMLDKTEINYSETSNVMSRIGDTCPQCGKGKLKPSGKRQIEREDNSGHDYVGLECDHCDYTTTTHDVTITEKIQVKEDVVVQKFTYKDMQKKPHAFQAMKEPNRGCDKCNKKVSKLCDYCFICIDCHKTLF